VKIRLVARLLPLNQSIICINFFAAFVRGWRCTLLKLQGWVQRIPNTLTACEIVPQCLLACGKRPETAEISSVYEPIAGDTPYSKGKIAKMGGVKRTLCLSTSYCLVVRARTNRLRKRLDSGQKLYVTERDT
jgi:hypothetical protein